MPSKRPPFNGSGAHTPKRPRAEWLQFAEERLKGRKESQPKPLDGKELEEYLVKARRTETADTIGGKLAGMGIERADAERIIRAGLSAMGLPPEIINELTNQRLKYYDEFIANQKKR